jgi:hypothetical protein
MNAGIDPNIDWTAGAPPAAEQFGVSMSGRRKAPPMPHTKASVMKELLGTQDLAAEDKPGSDPYNATGRFFRR